nr:hypothetical protein KRP22_3889 [Phytophthora ramorum]
MVQMIYPSAGEKSIVEALKLVAIQRQWAVAELLCQKIQTRKYDEALGLAERDDGRALLDLLFKGCRCYDAEKAVEEATMNANWTAIMLLADMCYQDSNNVRKAFRLAVEMDRWDVVKRLYKECSGDTVTRAMMQAAERGEWKVVRILRPRCSGTTAATALEPPPAERKDTQLVPALQSKDPTIRCIVPGNCPFEIDVASARTVNDLKKAIREERPDCFGDVSSDSIWLYLAKRGDEWLSADSEAINRLELGDSSLVRDLLVWQVMSTCHIQDMFEGAPQPSAIHIVALKPMLRCIIPGSRPFGVHINAITQTIALKRAIKAEMPDKLENVNANEIQLYVAKENGEWLPQSSDKAKALMLGGGSPQLNPMLATQLSSMAEVGNPFADVFAIHMIVMTPNRVLGALRRTSSTKRFHLDILRVKLLQLQ